MNSKKDEITGVYFFLTELNRINSTYDDPKDLGDYFCELIKQLNKGIKDPEKCLVKDGASEMKKDAADLAKALLEKAFDQKNNKAKGAEAREKYRREREQAEKRGAEK